MTAATARSDYPTPCTRCLSGLGATVSGWLDAESIIGAGNVSDLAVRAREARAALTSACGCRGAAS